MKQLVRVGGRVKRGDRGGRVQQLGSTQKISRGEHTFEYNMENSKKLSA